MALLHLARRLAPAMVAAGEGAIITTGNTSALRGKAAFAGFAPTKAAQRMLAESIAREVGPKGVHVAYVMIGRSRIRTAPRGRSTSSSGRFARRGEPRLGGEASMSQLRIFSYLPNPRIWKATIAARLCGVEVEVRGSSPKELQSWLWDFDARPLSSDEAAASADVRVGRVGFRGTSLRKTDAFMEAHPFGTVPAAFSPDGKVGIFESNSIMRAVARLGESRFPLYGRGPYEASRVDSFLDASLVFARDAQIYLLALMSESVSPEIHSRARDGFATYAAGIDQALAADRQFLVGGDVTLADICFVAEMSLLFNEKARVGALERQGLDPILHTKIDAEFPRAMGHLARLRKHPAFAPDVDPYLAKLEAP